MHVLAWHARSLSCHSAGPQSLGSNIALRRRGRRPMIAVGDRDGTIRLLNRNGTQRSTLETGGSVHAMERNGAILAVGIKGAGVSIFDMAKPKVAPMSCEADPDASADAYPVSVVWDSQLTQLVYAGGSDGVVRIYNTKARSRQLGGTHGNESRMVTQCKLVSTIVGHEPSPLHLAAQKGWLFSTSRALLAVHNVSGLYDRKREEPTAMLGRPLPSSLPGTAGLISGTGGTHLAYGGGAAGEIWMVESKLTYRDPSEEFKFGGESMGDFASPTSLLRNPVVLGVIMMVVFWQTNKFWGKGGGGGSGGGGGGGRGGGGDADFNPADMFKQVLGTWLAQPTHQTPDPAHLAQRPSLSHTRAHARAASVAHARAHDTRPDAAHCAHRSSRPTRGGAAAAEVVAVTLALGVTLAVAVAVRRSRISRTSITRISPVLCCSRGGLAYGMIEPIAELMTRIDSGMSTAWKTVGAHNGSCDTQQLQGRYQSDMDEGKGGVHNHATIHLMRGRVPRGMFVALRSRASWIGGGSAPSTRRGSQICGCSCRSSTTLPPVATMEQCGKLSVCRTTRIHRTGGAAAE